jgi:membrane protease subunit (stomatin/prohibitin family)
MGFFDKIRNELVDIIEWIDDTNQTLVWRFPRYQNEIKNGAQLIVRPGQKAVFVNEGKIADVFEPGTYELTTANMPILSTLKGWKYGFNSPFKAEVYFVSTKQITNLKWGTKQEITVRDPDFDRIRIRAFGTYALRAADPKALLRQLVGTDGVFEADEIGETVRDLIVSSLTSLLGESKIAASDLAGNFKPLNDQLKIRVQEQIDDEYGLELPMIAIVNVSFPEEVAKSIDANAAIRAQRNMGAYQQYQFSNAMMASAQNPSGPNPGMGMGMGVAMAGQMMNPGMYPGFQAAPPPAAAPPPLPPPLPAFHVNLGGQPGGPFDAGTLAQLVAQGRLKPDTLVWTNGMAAWTPAGQVPQVAQLFTPAGPPPLPPG